MGVLVLDAAEATTCTGEETVAPFAGLDTVTPAKAGTNPKKTKTARGNPSLMIFRESLVKSSPRL
jgi:hypothetical protein